MTTLKQFASLAIIVLLFTMPVLTVSAQIPGWDVGPGWLFPSYYITASNDAGCTLTPNGTVTVDYGDDQTFNYAAASGYVISEVIVDGTHTAISTPTGSYTFNNVDDNHTITITTTALPAATATPTSAPTPPGATPTPVANPHDHPTETLNLYMRSDTYTFNSLTAYGLSQDYTNTAASIIATTAETNATLTYGFRTYIASSNSIYQELTNGNPQAQIAVSGNQTAQPRSGSWTSPDTTVVLGAQVLKIDLYAKVNNDSWALQASYITNPLLTKEIMPTTWTLALNLEISSTTGNTTTTLRFGDTTYRSTVTGIVIVTPNYTDIQGWQWSNGDIIGVILGSYLYILGPVFYVLIYTLIFGGLYFRHRTFNPAIFLLVLMGGAGGVSAWVMLPAWAATILSVLVIVAIASLIFKVIR